MGALDDIDVYNEGEEWVHLEGEIKHRTKKAILFLYEGKEYWFPLSQIIIVSEEIDGECEITVPEWLALDKELI